MEVISAASESVLKILKGVTSSESPNKWQNYCIDNSTEAGHLVFNLLTRQLIYLTEGEWESLLEKRFLQKNVATSENCNDKEFADLVRWVLSNKQKETKRTTGYTIFPTTDCNARCFYCFELGRSRMPMTKETAEKTAYYIQNHCGGHKVSLSWFGGEPLYNREAIEIICRILKKENVEFKSSAVSNGYLFDKDTVETAVRDWNLKSVQITLDGTEETYNKVKAFVYKGVNPYQTVMENIGHLLDAEVRVQIRLNMDLYNAEDLMKLVEELAERFVRGDTARNSEGNGLGLSIARSLTQLQNGTLELTVDGDLFKAVLRFPTL